MSLLSWWDSRPTNSSVCRIFQLLFKSYYFFFYFKHLTWLLLIKLFWSILGKIQLITFYTVDGWGQRAIVQFNEAHLKPGNVKRLHQILERFDLQKDATINGDGWAWQLDLSPNPEDQSINWNPFHGGGRFPRHRGKRGKPTMINFLACGAQGKPAKKLKSAEKLREETKGIVCNVTLYFLAAQNHCTLLYYFSPKFNVKPSIRLIKKCDGLRFISIFFNQVFTHDPSHGELIS